VSDSTPPPGLLAPVGVPLQAGELVQGRRALPRWYALTGAGPLEDGASPDFARAVKLVTGLRVDLRGPAAPAGGWLTWGGAADGTAWGYTAGGTVFFTVSRNDKAATDWCTAAWVYENVDQEVFAGRFGVMDVQRLRDAEQQVGHRVDLLNGALDQIGSITSRADGGELTGSAASVLIAKLRGLSTSIAAHRAVLTVPPPTVRTVLHDAAEALAECGRALSYVWWESNQVLLGAPDTEIAAVRGNIDAYLGMNGLGATTDSGVGQPVSATPDAIRQVLARYSSTAAGDLPAGMGTIAGDLTQQAVWDAVNAAITKRISAELDKLDPVARTQIAKVRTAYDAAAARLAAVPPLPLDRIRATTSRRLFRALEAPALPLKQVGQPLQPGAPGTYAMPALELAHPTDPGTPLLDRLPASDVYGPPDPTTALLDRLPVSDVYPPADPA
jgi:hypothetical protein